MTMTNGQAHAVKGNGLVVVDEALRARAGVFVWWRLSGDVTLDALTESWRRHTHAVKELLPNPVSPETAIRRALAKVEGRRMLVRPLDVRGAWALVEEFVAEHETTGKKKLTHVQRGTVRLDARYKPEFEDVPAEIAQVVEANYGRELDVLSASDISAWLVQMVAKLSATSLRERGGVYFIPQPYVAAWERLVKAVRACSAHKMYSAPAMRSDDVVEAVLDSITEEAQLECAALEKELTTEDDGEGLGVRALKTRADRAQRMARKVGDYEQLFSVKLDALRARLEDLQTNIGAAVLAAEADAS